MNPYTALFRIRFINMLQYRAAALAGSVTQYAWGFMEIFAFAAFYRSRPEAFPMAFSQTVSYIWMQQAFMALFFVWFWENDIVSSIESGSIAYELVRPMDLYSRWFVQIIAARFARAMLRCWPILLVAFILPQPFRLSFPPDIGQFILFILSAVLTVGVVASFSMIIYVSVFYTLNNTGVRTIAAVLTDLLAGAYIPLPFFPDNIRGAAEWLPFASMQNMPLRIYSGHIAGAEAAKGIALQIFWLFVLLFIGRISMGRALKKVIVQGG